MPKAEVLGLDKDERIVLEIKRHPIGLIGIFFITILALLLAGMAMFLSIRYDSLLGLSEFENIVAIAGAVVVVIIIIFGVFAEYIYTKNELIITNQNIIQILQFSIFNRQVSQLNLAKIQDVSTDQAGFFANIFKYGTITIETAGEAANFSFRYAPAPNRVAKQIIEAHEEYTKNISGLSHSIRI